MIGHMNRFTNLLVDYYIVSRLAKENPGAAAVADKILTFVGLVVWFGFIITDFLIGLHDDAGAWDAPFAVLLFVLSILLMWWLRDPKPTPKPEEQPTVTIAGVKYPV